MSKNSSKATQREAPHNNFVHKHMHKFNRTAVFVDQKKRQRAGWEKHKGSRFNDVGPFHMFSFGCI